MKRSGIVWVVTSRIPARMDRRAFTLVELMVVVAIIMMLISLLTPSLHQAQARARTMNCVNQLKQMGTALFLHADHYNGILSQHNKRTVQSASVTIILRLCTYLPVSWRICRSTGLLFEPVVTAGQHALFCLERFHLLYCALDHHYQS